MAHYIRNEDADVPPAGRFNYGQKMLFWVMALGGLALLVSGLVIWFVDAIPVGSSRASLRGDARARRCGARDHRRVHRPSLHGVLRRARRRAAILHGEVSEEWARAHHPLWLAGMKKTMTDSVSQPADARAPAPDVRPRL